MFAFFVANKRLVQEEKAHRSEMNNSKTRYDNKIALLQEENHCAQMHLEMVRRERDALRLFLQFYNFSRKYIFKKLIRILT